MTPAAPSPDCNDCAHMIKSPAQWCMAPQLARVLDSTDGKRNVMSPCEGIRDIRDACGHKARWFVKAMK